ncbi:MAG: 4-hydroxy-tetrahydrodipicolinate synthase [Parvularculaceae bacterium]
MTEIHGSITALITPFKNGAVDAACFERLVERQIEGGGHGIVPVGTTGESATLSHDEHCEVVQLCVEAAAGRIPVIAGAGSNSTREAIALAQFAEKAGAEALLAVTGYYNKPSQAGLIAHYTALHDAVNLPIIIYNIPPRAVVDLSVETMATLSKLPRIVGIKDATGDLARVARHRLACEEGFIQLSGEDMTAVGYNAMGGRGCISVTSNVVPALCAEMQEACLESDYVTALALQDRLAPLHGALFSDVSPGPVKYAMALMGLCSDELRLPLAPPSEAAKQKVRAALEGLELIG